ncbi:GNAT family N-acetyltransferase [Helicobacter kayseriensis]|uniref:GNAT family N-acetyltransferase n=1 Tax=Helicobacter kayseriensis TaxID=2905877 RepID=UPI001E2A1E58|nr:GNAT family protein [Helicobacter kayseriensis]MCE3046671.1 GNAT family N-acetyltransferase [Helicobacter kayseriensis]MCE3048027.1 GNAT family N-acetyltransferase [Helicobacter kayseriensis]
MRQIYKYNMKRFLEGELVDLYIPSEKFIQTNQTFEWWNNSKITKFLESGIKRNTLDDQLEYFKNTQNITFFYDDKTSIIGTTILQDINASKKTAIIGFIRGEAKKDNTPPLQTLEAIAHTMDYAFNTLELERIFAIHHIGHIRFSHLLSLLGYRLEGIFRKDFIKNDWSEIDDRIHTVCHREDYNLIISKRGGSLWDQHKKMLQRAKLLPKTPFHILLQDFFNSHRDYYNNIFSL